MLAVVYAVIKSCIHKRSLQSTANVLYFKQRIVVFRNTFGLSVVLLSVSSIIQFYVYDSLDYKEEK